MDGLDDSLLIALGEITFAYSELESALAMYLWWVIDPMRFRTGMVITAGMDFRKMMDTFAALVLDRVDPDDTSPKAQAIRDRLKVVLTKVEIARENRNTIAHSRWLTSAVVTVVEDDPKSIILRVKQSKDQKKGWKMQFEGWKIDRFESVLANIRDSQNELSEFAAFATGFKGLFPPVGALR